MVTEEIVLIVAIVKVDEAYDPKTHIETGMTTEKDIIHQLTQKLSSLLYNLYSLEDLANDLYLKSIQFKHVAAQVVKFTFR